MLSAGQIIKSSVKLYKENFVLYVRYLGILAALWVVLIGAGALLLGMTATTTQTGTNTYAAQASLGLMVLVGLVLGVATLAVSLALMRVMHKRYQAAAAVPMSDELFAVKPLIWPAIYTSILAGIFIVLGIVLFIIPGIILTVWYAFTTLTVAIEGQRGMAALKASRELSRGRWWSVLWCMVAPSFVFGIFSFILQMIIILPLDFFAIAGSNTMTTAGLLSQLLSAAVSILVMPLTTGALVILYAELKKHPLTLPAPAATSTL